MATAVELAQAAQGVIVAIAAPLAVYVANRGINALRSRLHLDISAQQQATLDNAAITGAGIAVTMMGTGDLSQDSVQAEHPQILNLAKDAVNSAPMVKYVPDFLVKDMARLIVSKVGQMVSADPTIPTIPQKQG